MTEKVLFITGASSGIGAATAKAAADRGWRVALAARSAASLEALAGEIGADRALALPCDVTQMDDLEGALARTLQKFGQLDAAFANAGLGASAVGTAGGDPANWRTMIDVNIWGLLLTAKVCLPALREAKGHLLMTGSRAGVAAMKGSVYGATKWFVRGYAANLRLEMAEWGGRCTLIAPGMVDTPFFDEPKPAGLTADDVARAVLYALQQPDTVNINEVLVTPNSQAN
jgi:NADP-dependent 3-hydroxy acid dehydrogenase YdfG